MKVEPAKSQFRGEFILHSLYSTGYRSVLFQFVNCLFQSVKSELEFDRGQLLQHYFHVIHFLNCNYARLTVIKHPIEVQAVHPSMLLVIVSSNQKNF